jgi:serine/threonine protein kinase/Tol biopolymer transport system component
MERLQQIEEIFQEALQRDPDRRDAYVRQACHGDTELEREVISLLEDHDRGETFEPWAADAAAQLIDASHSLQPGQALGPYRIESFLAAGGMGAVYRATDTRLHRQVAIKISAARFTERFEREARVIASLNHPNICQLYDVGPNYLVMELVEGPTLADRVRQGPIPLDEALAIALHVAEALETAHEKGRVHRDLKPANVKITPEGVVKLLDFGLAKAAEEPVSAGNLSDSPTQTISPTRAGVILGTAPYMSPEQARGAVVDKRSDIWAFGCVLYEMLSGKQAFHGDTTSDILAAVLKDEPDWSRIPAKVRPLLRRCLEKDPKQRLRDIGDAPYLLDESPAMSPSRSRLGIGASIAAGALFFGLGALSFIHFRETPPHRAVLRYTISPPGITTFVDAFAISPDGRYVAMTSQVNGKRQLWLRALDGLQAQPIPGTDDARYPFWSPNSRYVGFFAQEKLKKIPANGGPAQSLCSVVRASGGSWNRDDVIVFSSSRGAIQSVSASGGAPAEVLKVKGTSGFPVFLPDGRHFLHFETGLAEEQGVYLSSLDGKENARVLADQSSAVFAAGRLLFIRENTLMAQPFDVASGHVTGEALPVAEGVSVSLSSRASVTVSETGVLVYQSGMDVTRPHFAWYDRGGKLLGPVGAGGFVYEPAISPDEKSIAFRREAVGTGMSDLWLRDLVRGAEQRFTTDASGNWAPFWSPQGDRIVFASTRGSGTLAMSERIYNLYQKAASGTGRDEALLVNGNSKVPSQWSRDGRFVIYSELDPKTKYDIWALPMESGVEQKPFVFLHSEFDELHGQLSPDSHWMAYTSDESGRREVYVRPFPGGGFQRRISIEGGEQPRWRGDGKELFFVGEDGRMMTAAVTAVTGAKPSFEPKAPQPLFDADLVAVGSGSVLEYDVTADGKRFLVDTRGGSASAPPLNVVVNWDARLKK